MSAPTTVRFGRGSKSAFRAGRGEKENGKDVERIKDTGTGRGTLRSARGGLGIRGITQSQGVVMTDCSALCREIAGPRDEDGVVAEMES